MTLSDQKEAEGLRSGSGHSKKRRGQMPSGVDPKGHLPFR